MASCWGNVETHKHLWTQHFLHISYLQRKPKGTSTTKAWISWIMNMMFQGHNKEVFAMHLFVHIRSHDAYQHLHVFNYRKKTVAEVSKRLNLQERHEWTTHWLTSWLSGWLTGYAPSWLPRWLHELSEWRTDSPANLTDRVRGCLTNWPTDWLPACMRACVPGCLPACSSARLPSKAARSPIVQPHKATKDTSVTQMPSRESVSTQTWKSRTTHRD